MSNKNTKVQNPHLAKYWVGKLVDLEDQISFHWEFEDDSPGDNFGIAVSKEFKNRKDYEAWVENVCSYPVLLTSTNGEDEIDVEDAHFYWTFVDGTTLEAPCCICIDHSGFGKGPQIPQHMGDEIARYDQWVEFQFKPKS